MIGDIIQEKRKEAGLTQAQLAERLGVTPPAVNRWEKNLSFPDATLLAPLARLLKTDMNTLFSFYDTLSDTQREMAVTEATEKFLKEEEQDALSFVDGLIQKNLSDGILYKKLAEMLHGLHVLQKAKNPTKYLDRIAAYYERAMELSPEYTEEISYALITIYAQMGQVEKAETAWRHLPECKHNKKWAHAEMQFMLKNHEAAAAEVKECVLRRVIDLVMGLNFLKDAFIQSGDEALADLAREKSCEVIELFDLWKGFVVLGDITKSSVTSDGDSMFKNISAFVSEKPTGKNISGSPLFEDVRLGGVPKEEMCVADAMADIFNALSKNM